MRTSRESIEKMSNDSLDRAIGLRVMGWRDGIVEDHADGRGCTIHNDWAPSRRWDHALEVIERVRHTITVNIQIDYHEGVVVYATPIGQMITFDEKRRVYCVYAGAAPLAVARAALWATLAEKELGYSFRQSFEALTESTRRRLLDGPWPREDDEEG